MFTIKLSLTSSSVLLVLIALASLIAFAEPSGAEEGKPAASFQKIQLSDQFFCEGATCADIDGDGHQDFIGGPHWFAGSQFTEKHEYRPGEPFDIAGYSDNFFTFASDFNRDGRVDILVVGFPGKEAFWYENPGPTSEHWQRRLALAIVDNESPSLVDMNGDDAPDLLCQSEGRFGYLEAPEDPTKGAWPFRAISPNLHYQRFTHGLGQGDLNGDGRTDLLEKHGWWEQPAAATAEALWKFHPMEFSNFGGAQMYGVDLDGDGDQDIVTSKAAHAYGLSWFENLGAEDSGESDSIAFREHAIMDADPATSQSDPMFSQLHAVAIADMNNDGVADIVTGKRYWAHGGHDPGAREPAVLYWYETVRSDDGVKFRPHLIDMNSGVGTQVEARDFNGDGLTDVVVGNKKGLFVFLQKD